MKVRVNVANCWVGVEGLTGSVKVKFNLCVVGHVVAVDGDLDGVAHQEKHHNGHQSEHPLLWRGDRCCYSLEIIENILAARTTTRSLQRGSPCWPACRCWGWCRWGWPRGSPASPCSPGWCSRAVYNRKQTLCWIQGKPEHAEFLQWNEWFSCTCAIMTCPWVPRIIIPLPSLITFERNLYFWITRVTTVTITTITTMATRHSPYVQRSAAESRLCLGQECKPDR